MPRKRLPENKGLPARWRCINGVYYYQVPPGSEGLWEGKKTFLLGRSKPEAYRAWTERLEAEDRAGNIGQLLDRYALEVVPTKSAASQTGNTTQIGRVRAVFGHMQLQELQPKDIYKYVDKRDSKTNARLEVALLSHAFTKAVEWGYIDRHPFKGQVRLKGSKPRTRYVEDAEIVACLSMEPSRKGDSITIIQSYIRLKLLTGLRQGDLLRITEDCLREDGIHITPRKTQGSTGKQIIYAWTDSLREAVRLAKEARPVDISPYLFCTRRGKGYIDEQLGRSHGWASIWQRFMTRLLKETDVVRFTEHDLRAKVASDATSLQHAQALLAHADMRMTNRVYRRKPEVIAPLK
jgi:integrase